AHNTMATALSVGLYTLNVPNPLLTGFDSGKTFDVAAVSIKGQIKAGTDVVTGPNGPILDQNGHVQYRSLNDFYKFQGQAGDLLNFAVLSARLTRIQNPIDPIIKISGPDGNLVPYYQSTAVDDDAFEAPDSSLVDLVLPATGTYTIEIDPFRATPDQTFFLDPNDPNYNPAAYYGTDTGDYEVFGYRFAAFNAAS